MKRKKGFTLVEVIVVIAIIGVLAAVLVPTLTGYINKARRLADKSAASAISKAGAMMTEETEIRQAFYDSTQKYNVSVESGSNTESYDFVAVCMYKEDSWEKVSPEAADLVDLLNREQLTDGRLEVRYHGGDKKVDCWIIGFNPDVKDSFEVWTGESSGSGCTPCYRVYPNPDNEYA